MNLAEQYAALVAKRPDLAIEGLYVSHGGELTIEWIPDFTITGAQHEGLVTALILKTLVEALPDPMGLVNLGDFGWVVANFLNDETPYVIGETPLEALFAFHLSQKGSS